MSAEGHWLTELNKLLEYFNYRCALLISDKEMGQLRAISMLVFELSET